MWRFVLFAAIAVARGTESVQIVCVTTTALNFRKCASTSCGILGTEPKGKCFEFIENEGDWVKVKWEHAYAHSDFVTAPSAKLCASFGTEWKARCACVDVSALNFRKCDSNKCDILGTLPFEKCLEVLDNTGDWIKVKWYAYAHGNYLTSPYRCETSHDYGNCFGTLCEGNPSNALRGSDKYGSGSFGASREVRTHSGVDVICSANSIIYAPVSGILSKSIPYGDGQCCDDGFRIEGVGVWKGYVVKVWYNSPKEDLVNTVVSRGQAVASHIGLLCGCYGEDMTDHAHIQITLYGNIIDPTYYLMGCN